jgi:hypothetical protein
MSSEIRTRVEPSIRSQVGISMTQVIHPYVNAHKVMEQKNSDVCKIETSSTLQVSRDSNGI